MNESAGIDILHVDDEPEFLEVAADILEGEREEFTVETAVGVSEGRIDLLRTTSTVS